MSRKPKYKFEPLTCKTKGCIQPAQWQGYCSGHAIKLGLNKCSITSEEELEND